MGQGSAAALVLLGLVACARSGEHLLPEVIELRGEALGTTWHVRYVEPSRLQVDPAEVRRGAEAALEAVDRAMSTWREDSELSLARRSQGPVPVSEATAAVVQEALDLAAMTGGAFDPTVQPLMELWGFHGEPIDAVPEQGAIEQVMGQVGWSKVSLRRDEAGMAQLDVAGAALDLSAIAKGYAVDRVFHQVSALGVGSLFVEVGGEVRVGGPGASGPLWKVGVSLPSPEASPSSFALIAALTNGAVATSGNYRNRRVIGDQTFAHTMDPRTGRPVESDLGSVTVFAPMASTADALATALMVLGPDQGLALIERLPDVEAAVLFPDGDRFSLRQSSGFGAGRTVQIVSDRVSVLDHDGL